MKYMGWVDILDYISTNMDGTLLCGLGSVWKLGRMLLLPSSSLYLTGDICDRESLQESLLNIWFGTVS